MRRPNRPVPRQPRPRHPSLDYRPPAYLRRLRWAVITVVGIAAAGALYTGFWFFMANQLRDGILNWADARRAEGLTVTYRRLDIGGFPYILDLRIEAPRIAAPHAATPWEWRTGSLSARMPPWNPNRVTIEAPAGHRITRAVNGSPATLRAQARTARTRLTLDGGRLAAADIALRDLEIAAPDRGWTASAGRADLLARLPSDPDTPALRLDADLAGLRLPDSANLPLGPEISSLSVEAEVTGTVTVAPPVEALSLWRDGGGTVELPRVELAYGPLGLQADGTLALDADLQPVGAFSARVEGFFETVDTLRNQGLIRSSDATAAKLVLGVLARRGQDGRPEISLPLTIRDRRLHAGPVSLIDLPEIDWGPPVRAVP